MKLDTLREFIVVAKHLNITKAAQELYVSQPSLSARMGALERELGFPLFERTRNGIAVTPAGSVLLEYAQRIMALHDEALEKARAAARRPTVKVGTLDPSSDAFALLPSYETCPYTFVDLGINTSAIDALLQGVLDVAIEADYTVIDELRKKARGLGISLFRIGASSATIAVMAHDPLARKKDLARSDMAGRTVVINSGSHFDSWSKMVQWMLGDDVKMAFRMNPLESMSNLALTDFGDSLYICGGECSHQHLEQRTDVVLFDEVDGEKLVYPVALMCRTEDAEDPKSPVGRFVTQFLERQRTTTGHDA